MQTFYKGGCAWNHELYTKRHSFSSMANNMAKSLSLSSLRHNSISSHGGQKPRVREATGERSHGVGEVTSKISHGWEKPRGREATCERSHGWEKPRAGKAMGKRSHGREKPCMREATGGRSHGWEKPWMREASRQEKPQAREATGEGSNE